MGLDENYRENEEKGELHCNGDKIAEDEAGPTAIVRYGFCE